MDRLDKISILAIAALLIGSVALIRLHTREPKIDRNQQKAAAVDNPASTAELDKAQKLIKKFLEAESLNQAEGLIRELMQKYPYQGEPHMLMGDLFMRKQEPVRAMHEYKQAVDFNPDYLDKKTPFFQGKKLKVAAGEALAEIESRLRQNPGDDSLRSEKKIIYYLYRKIAGSCGS